VELIVALDAGDLRVDAALLRSWTLEQDAVMAQAVSNLAARDPEPFWPLGSGLYRARVADHRDLARLTLTEQISSLPLSGAPIALVVPPSTLLLLGDADPGAAHAAAERLSGRSALGLIWSNRRWAAWAPPAESPLDGVVSVQ